MADMTMQAIEETLTHFRQILSSDGGKLDLVSFDDDAGRLTVEYNKGYNEHCAECVITHDHLELFIKEALQSRKAGVREVKVVGE